MGYNEIHGLTGGGGFDFSNFRGKGQMLSVSYNRGLQNQNQLGTQNTSYSNNNSSDFESFSLSFREPRIFDTGNSIGFSYSHSEQGRGSSNVLQYDIVSDRGSIMFGRRFDWPDYRFRGSWTLSMRNTKYIGLYEELQDNDAKVLKKAISISLNDLDIKEFTKVFESDLLKHTTLEDFRYSQKMGITGFPTLVGKEQCGDDQKLALISAGYQPHEQIKPVIDHWLEFGLEE